MNRDETGWEGAPWAQNESFEQWCVEFGGVVWAEDFGKIKNYIQTYLHMNIH